MVSMSRLTQLPPRLLIPLVTKLIQFAHVLLAWLIPPPLQAVQLAFEGRAISEVMRTACALNIAEALADGPKTAKDLSLIIGADADRLFRMLRFAALHGVFGTVPSTRKEPQSASSLVFRNNRLSDTLRSDHELSQKAMVLLAVGKQYCGDGWTELEWGVRTGGLCFERVHGAPFFEHMPTVPGAMDVFCKAMHAMDSLAGPSVLVDYDWKKFGRYVDIGGAYGTFLAHLMAANPSARGTLFDRPHVIEESEQLWRTEGKFKAFLPRVDFATGDFFTPGSLPQASGADDVFILRQICHDWPDGATIRILKSVRAAMGSTKCMLALVEAVILPTSCSQILQNRARTVSDLHMMVQHDGKERATHEWREVLAAAGFALQRVVPTRSIFSVVEAVPVPLDKLV